MYIKCILNQLNFEEICKGFSVLLSICSVIYNLFLS